MSDFKGWSLCNDTPCHIQPLRRANQNAVTAYLKSNLLRPAGVAKDGSVIKDDNYL